MALAIALGGCGSQAAKPHAPVAPDVDYARLLFPHGGVITAASAAPEKPAPPPETGTATWRNETDEYGPIWVRSHGARASDLVLRGTTSPSNPDYTGQYFASGARLVTSIRLRTEGPVPALRVWAMARGPMGILVDGFPAEGGAGDPLVVDLTQHAVQLPGGSSETRPSVEGEVLIRIADIDRPNVRRGQTAPYVIVVTEDLAAPRTETPAPPPPLSADALKVRWDMQPVACAHPESMGRCYRAAAIVGGARVAVPGTLEGQSDCFPDGLGLTCEGASGGTIYDFRVEPSGKATLMSHLYSDGACEIEGSDCGIHTKVLSFRIPAGKHLVADPAGTFPPMATRPD